VAVKIRLKRLGKVRVPQYRIVIVDSRKKRDGRVIEEIGKYHPKEDPSYISVVSERAQYWLGVGAQPTEAVSVLLKVTGDWQTFQGLPGTEGTLKVKDAKRDKQEIFNEALKEAHGSGGGSATTKTAKAEKPAKSDEKTETKNDKADAKTEAKADAKTEAKAEAKADAEAKTPDVETPEGATEEAEANEPAEKAPSDVVPES